MRKYPPWQRDELILALDLYFRIGARINVQHPEIIRLSHTLRLLPLNLDVQKTERYRTPNAVHLKLQNFLALDPSYAGVGLSHGGRIEGEIWREFFDKKPLLSRLTRAITESSNNPRITHTLIELEEEEFPEGRILYRLHRIRERKTKLVRKLKLRALQRGGRVVCEACGFDFENTYGHIGRGYIECHHNFPVSEIRAGCATRLKDLTLLCANCHRMIHRKRPWISVEELSRILQGTK